MSPRTKVIGRIHRLLALTGSAEAAEADAAGKMARELMEKFRIGPGDIRDWELGQDVRRQILRAIDRGIGPSCFARALRTSDRRFVTWLEGRRRLSRKRLLVLAKILEGTRASARSLPEPRGVFQDESDRESRQHRKLGRIPVGSALRNRVRAFKIQGGSVSVMLAGIQVDRGRFRAWRHRGGVLSRAERRRVAEYLDSIAFDALHRSVVGALHDTTVSELASVAEVAPRTVNILRVGDSDGYRVRLRARQKVRDAVLASGKANVFHAGGDVVSDCSSCLSCQLD
jgi:hypothetical protein